VRSLLRCYPAIYGKEGLEQSGPARQQLSLLPADPGGKLGGFSPD
jgi:hypothetical protein